MIWGREREGGLTADRAFQEAVGALNGVSPEQVSLKSVHRQPPYPWVTDSSPFERIPQSANGTGEDFRTDILQKPVPNIY